MHAWVAFVALVDQDREAIAYPSMLARFAIKRVRDDRRIGSKTSTVDILSKRCQRVHNVCQATLGAVAGNVEDGARPRD